MVISLRQALSVSGAMGTLAVAGLLFLANPPAAHAGGVIFNFNGLANNTGAPSSGADNSSAVTANMNAQLHTVDPNWNVTVTGAESSGSATSPGYTGDGNVVCKAGTYGTSCIPETLSTLTGNPFVETSGKYTYGGDNAIKMSFSSNVPSDPVRVSSLQFSFEIFPSSGESAANPADFTFIMTDGSGGLTTVENCTVLAVALGQTSSGACTSPLGATWNGSYSGGASNSTGNLYAPLNHTDCTAFGNTWSTANGGKCIEKNDQFLGTMTFNFPTTVSSAAGPINLYFIDWPDDVAVTNIDWGVPVPEPTTLALLASGLIVLGFYRRRGRAA